MRLFKGTPKFCGKYTWEAYALEAFGPYPHPDSGRVRLAPAKLTYGDFQKLGVPFLGVPIIRTIVYWGLYWGPLIVGNYHILSQLWKRVIGLILILGAYASASREVWQSKGL